MPDRYHFDRSKPFYPHVLSFFISLHGFKEALVSGILSKAGFRTEIVFPENFPESTKAELRDAIQKLKAPLNLTVTNDTNTLDIPLDFVSQELIDNWMYLIEYLIPSASMVIALAYEDVKGKLVGPQGEFLRHCRNAVAHNGKFEIRGALKTPAAWRGMSISPSMHGQPLFKSPKQLNGYLNLGDPIALLWDVEQEIS